MKFMEFQAVFIIIILLLVVGCIGNGQNAVNPRDGDLSLKINMEKTNYDLSPDALIVEIILENVGSNILIIEDGFSFGHTLFPNVTDSDGNEVLISYPLLDYEPTYSNMKPGEKRSSTVDLAQMAPYIEIGDDRNDFNWNRAGQYSINVYFYGTKNPLEVKSNTILFQLNE